MTAVFVLVLLGLAIGSAPPVCLLLATGLVVLSAFTGDLAWRYQPSTGQKVLRTAEVFGLAFIAFFLLLQRI